MCLTVKRIPIFMRLTQLAKSKDLLLRSPGYQVYESRLALHRSSSAKFQRNADCFPACGKNFSLV